MNGSVNKRHITIITAVLVGVFALFSSPLAEASWTQPRKDNINTNYQPSPSTSSESLVNLEKLWENQIGEGTDIDDEIITADLNGDGYEEVYTYSTSRLAAFDYDGSLLWSKSYEPSGILAVDIDEDGQRELVAGHEGSDTIDYYNPDGTLDNSIGTVYDIKSPLTGGYVDTDENLDLIFTSHDAIPNAYINAIDMNGDYALTKEFSSDYTSRNVHAVANIDNDSPNEIVITTNQGYIRVFYTDEGGNHEEWNVNLNSETAPCYSDPTLCQLDDDDNMEIVFGVPTMATGKNLFVYDGGGTEQWSKEGIGDMAGSVAVADIDGDSENEIIAPVSENLIAYEADGTEKWRYTAENYLNGVSIGDLDDEPGLEIVATEQMDNDMYILENDGSLIEKKPIGSPNTNPTISDIDDDGINNILVTGGEKLQVFQMAASGSSGSSVLNVKAKVPDYSDNITINVTGPGTSVAKSMRPGFVENITGLTSGEYTVEAPEIEGYGFEKWSGDISSRNRSASVHLSEKTVVAEYEKVLGTMPPSPPSGDELSISVDTGRLIGEEFVLKDEFTQGSAVAVEVILEYGGERLDGATVVGDFEGEVFNLSGSGDGVYYGSFDVRSSEDVGRHVVKAQAQTDHGDIKGSDTFSVTSWQSPEPEEFPSWFKWSALLALFLLLGALYMAEDEWGKTPQNWTGPSKPGSWTYSLGNAAVIGLFLGALLLALFNFGIISSGSALYLGIASIIVTAFVTELSKVDKPLAVIGFTTEHWASLVIAGVAFGISYLYAASWLTGQLGLAIAPMSLPMAMGLVGLPAVATISLGGFAVPILEEGGFRGVLSPLLSEKLGILVSIMGSALSFGLIHVVFGGGLGIFITASIFGAVAGYMTLRNQSLLFAVPAHMTYNLVVFVLSVGVSLATFLGGYLLALAVAVAAVKALEG
jgi:membrane protease YdiL (CAAX protease family)